MDDYLKDTNCEKSSMIVIKDGLVSMDRKKQTIDNVINVVGK